jgi:hypothetical protein
MKRVDGVAAMRGLFEAHGQGRVIQPPQVLTGVVTLTASKRTYSPIWSPDGLKQQCWP